MARTPGEKPGYDEFVGQLREAENTYEDAQIEIANGMADKIITDGGMTIH